MCLTCPKKVLKIKDRDVYLEDCRGRKTKAITIEGKIKKGDWVLTQANIVLKKITKQEADEINDLFKNKKSK